MEKKQVTLKQLTLTNWRGEEKRTTSFNETETTIQGANGLGKSRHFDAFIWLLFGKDKEGRKDYNIKSIVEGATQPKVAASVEGVLSVDGEEITLRRSLVEEWTKPRGAQEEVFKGNKTECLWNGTPISVTEYTKRVGEIIQDELFRLITNPLYFVSLPWQKQREQLFALAGNITYGDAAQDNTELAQFLNELGGKSVEDFKREQAAAKKRLKASLQEIQPRIDQTKQLMPEEADTTAAKEDEDRLLMEIANADKAIASVAERIARAAKKRNERQESLDKLYSERRELTRKAREEAEKRTHGLNAERDTLKLKSEELERRIGNVQSKLQALRVDKSRYNIDIETITNRQGALRNKWFEVNKSTYSGETTCAHCGQPLPEDKIATAKEIWNSHKCNELARITEEGKQLQAGVKEYEAHIEEIAKSITDGDRELYTLNAELAEAKSRLKEIPESVTDYDLLDKQVAELPEYKRISEEIKRAEENLKENEITTDSTAAYTAERAQLQAQLDAVKEAVRRNEERAHYIETIKELEAKGCRLASELAEVEKSEYRLKQLTKARVEATEKRINGRFKMVSFKLFDYTIEDAAHENPIETCIPLIAGVPFYCANTAAQVNAGIDIINVLSDYYQVAAPIFIDNRESVNELIPTQAQIINLKVTEDKELIVK